ncbi:hypothetical protein R3W88_011824 [Solanum pinnatisectum]|uniref:Gag-pol polyprotein n=1 Tax=Solanum pinnatisectum TaxID=50273 RepID=A0AAV9L7M2_9SOLN|nr:hypothetical protein R3W88_011824 [Solanum pinnatisectum]
MPPRRAVRGRPARRNVEEQELTNAPEVQPQGEVTNAEFREAIRMLNQVVTNQARQQRGARQEKVVTSRIHEFLRMNPQSFTSSSTAENPENFIEELKKVFDVMHVIDTVRVKLAAYQMKNVSRTWFEQWKGEEEKLRDREEFMNKRAKTGNESGVVGTTQVFIVRAPLIVSSVVKLGISCEIASSVVPPDRIAPRGATSGTGGGTNRLYAINNCQEKEDSPNIVTGMIQVFDFTVYALLDPGTSLSFVTPYIAMNFDLFLSNLVNHSMSLRLLVSLF